jgi:hypothetical protein
MTAKNDSELLLRIAVAAERLAEELCKPLPVPKRKARIGTATYTEAERNRAALKALAAKKQARRVDAAAGRIPG